MMQLLHFRDVPAESEGGLGYYAHVVALLVLYILWKLPAARAKYEDGSSAFVVRTTTKSPTRTLSKTLSKSCFSEADLQKAESELAQLHPKSTAAERRRFLLARKCDPVSASQQLAAYLEWQETHEQIEESHIDSIADKLQSRDSSGEDEDDWNRSVEIARKSCADDDRSAALPRLARMYHHNDPNEPVCDKDGYRIIHLLPGQIDYSLARPATYAVALALYLDRKLDRNSADLYTVLLDVRGGPTWPNVHPYKLLPFIQHVVKLLLQMFPERLYQCLLYPLPPACIWIWNLAKVCIDPITASKVRLLSGPAKPTSPPPTQSMQESMDGHVIALLERERKASF